MTEAKTSIVNRHSLQGFGARHQASYLISLAFMCGVKKKITDFRHIKNEKVNDPQIDLLSLQIVI